MSMAHPRPRRGNACGRAGVGRLRAVAGGFLPRQDRRSRTSPTASAAATTMYARLIARHMGKHIPGNPTVVPQNMPGAGGMRPPTGCKAPRRRTAPCSAPTSRAMAFEPLLGNKAAKYDPTKITYIGSANDEVSVCMAWHTSGVTTFEDVQQRELVVGAGGTADDTYQFPAILNNMFGAKFKMVHRLCRRQRDQHRDGARRGARPLRLPVVDGEGLASALDARQELQSADAVLARQACRPAGRAAGDGPRHDRRAAADPAADLRPAGDGPPLRGAARRAEGPRRRAAQGVHGHDGGQGVPRRRRQGAVRDHGRCPASKLEKHGARHLSDRRRPRSRRRPWRW